MRKIFSVLRNNRVTALVIAQSMVAILTTLISYRIVIAYHGQEQLGLWGLLTGIAAVSRVMDFSGGTLPRFVSLASKDENPALVADFVDTTAIALFVFYGAIILVAWLPFRWMIQTTVESGYVDLGLTVMPYMLVSVLVTVISSSMASALDGLMRADLRAKVMIGGLLLQLLWNFILIPRYGIIGLAIAQLIQFVTLFWVCRLLLKARIPGLTWLPLRWSRTCFRQSLGYGLQMQAVSLSASFIEPAIRLFVNAFGGLSFVALYDIANKIIIQVRVLAASAISPTVPVFAAAETAALEDRVTIIAKANRLTIFLASVLIFGASAVAPFVGYFMLGHFEPLFVYLCAILITGQFLTIPTIVQYYHALAVAKMKWNIAGLGLTGALTFVLSFPMGYYLGGLGVTSAAVAAAVIGSYFSFYKNARITATGSLTDAVPLPRHLLLLCASFASGLGLLFASEWVVMRLLHII